MAKKKDDAELKVKKTQASEEVDTEGDEGADADKKGRADSPMVELLKTTPALPDAGDVIEGPVIALGRAKVFVDLHPFGTGIIYGREYLSARETLKNVNIGDTVAATIVERENKDGYIELSLREARQALIWGEAEKAVNAKTSFELPITDANKGGLIITWQGIAGFLPASQLSGEHYPRVPDRSEEHTSELQSQR